MRTRIAHAFRRRRVRLRRGAVLIVTVLIVFGLAGMLLVLSRTVRVEAMASGNEAAMVQAGMVERGAEQYVLALLAQEKDSLSSITEDYFAQVPVGDGYFWILRPDYGDSDMLVYGLTEESAKLNINSATYNELLALPNMTDELAASVVDWRDTDDTISPGGAENEYYGSLRGQPYMCKNGPFETVEELLMVRGWDRQILYGMGNAPPLGQQQQIRRNAGFMTDLATARGLYDYLTIYSVEDNTAADGSQRININQRNQRTQLREYLRGQLGTTRGDEIANGMGRNDSYKDIFDFYFQEKLKPDEFAKIADKITTSEEKQLRGRINVLAAPREVLACLGLESGDVEKLLGARQSNRDNTGIGWVVEALDKKAVGLENKITTKTNRYSADILAVSGNGRAYKRVRIVVNTSGTTPQIVYRRDITERGWPMDMQILESLRGGQGLATNPGGRTAGLGGLRQ